MEAIIYKEILENIVDGVSRYLVENNIKSQVLGISGGIDSTVTAAICKLVHDKIGIPLIGLSLPCSTNADVENDSAIACGSEFCNSFKVLNLQEPYEIMETFCATASNIEKTPISQGNVKARLRMITLYDIASKTNGIVMGTSNKTDWLTGFWTLHGDVGDLNPIGELWKTEVYELARYLKDNVFNGSKALEKAMALIPTDGNGVNGGGDAEQIMPSYTYNDIDHVLSTWNNLSPKIKPMYAADKMTSSIKNTIFDVEDENSKIKRMEACRKSGSEFVPYLGDLYGVDSVRKVCMRSWNSEYKRKNLELCISLDNGNAIMH